MTTTDTFSGTVGWIGTGDMGAPMCRRLVDAGADVTVWNRTAAKADALVEAGARRASSPADLRTDVVFVTVTGAPEVEQVMTTLSAPVIVNCSTVTPEASARLRALAAERGATYLAAPISASAASAAEGNAVIVASGPADVHENVRPLLEHIARAAIYAGDGEAALLVKLCSNVLMGSFTHLLFETTKLAETGGADATAFLDFVNASLIGSPYSAVKGKQYLDGALHLPPHLRSLMARDFAMCLQIAQDLGAPMPISAAAATFI